MFNWFIIILIIAGILVLVKVSHLKHHKHKFGLMFFVILLLFFIASIYFVTSASNVDMSTTSGFAKGMGIYGGWLVNSFNNIKILTGNIIGMDWRPENKTVNTTTVANSNVNSVVNGAENITEVVIETAGSVTKIIPNTPKKIKYVNNTYTTS
jgi:hypothetical protein